MDPVVSTSVTRLLVIFLLLLNPVCTGDVFVRGDANLDGVEDISDAVSTIESVIIVTSPSGGETLLVDDPHTIAWMNIGTVGFVDIDYTPNGVDWFSIASGINNVGSHPWTVPDPPGSPFSGIGKKASPSYSRIAENRRMP